MHKAICVNLVFFLICLSDIFKDGFLYHQVWDLEIVRALPLIWVTQSARCRLNYAMTQVHAQRNRPL